jgi:hypothetical protein
MLFEFKLLIDDSSPLNPADAGGSLILHQGKHEARTDYVLLDIWFSELLNAYDDLKEDEDESWVDFSEEHGSLCFRLECGKITIDYKDCKFALPKAQFDSALMRILKELTAHFPDKEALKQSDTWLKVLKYTKE